MAIKGYDSSRLNNREKMLICNYNGVFYKAIEDAFAKLLGIQEPGDIFCLSTATAIKIREKLKKEVRK